MKSDRSKVVVLEKIREHWGVDECRNLVRRIRDRGRWKMGIGKRWDNLTLTKAVTSSCMLYQLPGNLTWAKLPKGRLPWYMAFGSARMERAYLARASVFMRGIGVSLDSFFFFFCLPGLSLLLLPF